MTAAYYFAEKAGRILAIIGRLKASTERDNSIELALLSLADEFMTRAEQELDLAENTDKPKPE